MAGELHKVLDLPARSRFGEGRAVPFYRQLLTMKNLYHFPSLAEPCDLDPFKLPFSQAVLDGNNRSFSSFSVAPIIIHRTFDESCCITSGKPGNIEI
jgi:hypothetical protein